MAGFVEKRGRGRYKARIRGPDGRERSLTFARKVDADSWLDQQRGALAQGDWVDPQLGRQRFTDFADEWAEAQDTWKETTSDGWPYIRARLVKHLGDMPLAAIDQLALKRLRAKLAADYAPATVKQTMAYAGMILRSAHAARRIGRDPTVGLRPKKARAHERADVVTPDDVPTRAEAAAILKGTPDRFRAGIALGLAGLRIGEVLGLRTDRIDLESRLVTVDRQMQRHKGVAYLTTPKAEKVRTVKVPAWVAFELRRHLREHEAIDGVLFRGGRGVPVTRRDQFYESAWRPALKGAGLAEDRFVFHACRHWCASMLLAEGAPITAVAGHLGDTVETVSRVYAHWLRDDRDVPAAVLDRILSPPATGEAEPDAVPGRPGGGGR